MNAAVTLIIILWVLCGIASGMIASNKGLSFGAYFVLGLVLGVIGVIIALASKGTPAARRQVTAPGWYPCPYTNGVIRYHDGYQWTQHTQAAVTR